VLAAFSRYTFFSPFALPSGLTAYTYRCILKTMKRTNINLREDQWTKLGKLSDRTGATMSALIRKAIDAYLKKTMK
jgi:hypothetical protein